MLVRLPMWPNIWARQGCVGYGIQFRRHRQRDGFWIFTRHRESQSRIADPKQMSGIWRGDFAGVSPFCRVGTHKGHGGHSRGSGQRRRTRMCYIDMGRLGIRRPYPSSFFINPDKITIIGFVIDMVGKKANRGGPRARL